MYHPVMQGGLLVVRTFLFWSVAEGYRLAEHRLACQDS